MWPRTSRSMFPNDDRFEPRRSGAAGSSNLASQPAGTRAAEAAMVASVSGGRKLHTYGGRKLHTRPTVEGAEGVSGAS